MVVLISVLDRIRHEIRNRDWGVYQQAALSIALHQKSTEHKALPINFVKNLDPF